MKRAIMREFGYDRARVDGIDVDQLLHSHAFLDLGSAVMFSKAMDARGLNLFVTEWFGREGKEGRDARTLLGVLVKLGQLNGNMKVKEAIARINAQKLADNEGALAGLDTGDIEIVKEIVRNLKGLISAEMYGSNGAFLSEQVLGEMTLNEIGFGGTNQWIGWAVRLFDPNSIDIETNNWESNKYNIRNSIKEKAAKDNVQNLQYTVTFRDAFSHIRRRSDITSKTVVDVRLDWQQSSSFLNIDFASGEHLSDTTHQMTNELEYTTPSGERRTLIAGNVDTKRLIQLAESIKKAALNDVNAHLTPEEAGWIRWLATHAEISALFYTLDNHGAADHITFFATEGPCPNCNTFLPLFIPEGKYLRYVWTQNGKTYYKDYEHKSGWPSGLKAPNWWIAAGGNIQAFLNLP